MIEKTETPYEYLVRFNPDGTIRGQHIRYLERITENGTVLVEREGEAKSIGETAQSVPLQTALGEVSASLARAGEAEKSAKDKATAALEAVKAELATVKAERDALALQPIG